MTLREIYSWIYWLEVDKATPNRLEMYLCKVMSLLDKGSNKRIDEYAIDYHPPKRPKMFHNVAEVSDAMRRAVMQWLGIGGK